MEDFSIAASIPLRHTPWTIVILVIAYITVLVVGLVGNVFVVAIVVKTPKMRTVTNYFILNLAIADLLVLIVCLSPSLISNIYVPWVMGSLMCKAVPYIQGVAVCASVYSLVAISGDRLMAIWFPLRRQITKRVARRIIVLIWIWAAGLALPWLLYFDISNADSKEPSLVFCTEKWPSAMNGNIYFALVNLGLFYLVPLGFISFCYISIWLRVWHRNVPKDSSVSQMELVHQRAKASVLKMVIVVVAVFAASWLPLYAIFVRIKLFPSKFGAVEEQVLDYALPLAQWLGASNSCINPILYAFFNRKFRIAFQRLLRGSSAWTTPTNFRNHHHNQGAGGRPNLVKLSIALQQSHRINNQLKNSRHNPVNSAEFNVVMLNQKNLKIAAIAGSQTYQF